MLQCAIAVISLLAAVQVAQAQLGVFANGVELEKSSAWNHPDGISYEAQDNVFVVSCAVNKQTGLPKLTISGTNCDGEVAIVIRNNSAVMIQDLCLRTTTTNKAPIKIDRNSRTLLFLGGRNRLEAAPWAAGVQLGQSSSLLITNAPGCEAASLVAIGGDEGAGIGDGHDCDSAESLTIAGGVITAVGHGEFACGIGQGLDGRVRRFLMTGGTVKARGDGGPDFGSGYGESYASLTITGGSLDVRSWEGGSPRDASSALVRKVTIHNADWTVGSRPSIAFSDTGLKYGTNSVFVDENLAIHLWLPKGRHAMTVDDLSFFVTVQSGWQTVNLSGNTFAEWCGLHGLEARTDALTDGEPNILRYVFDRVSGPLPMPTLDPSPKYPTAIMPPRKHVYSNGTLSIIGTTDLAPGKKWYDLHQARENPDLWIWTECPTPKSLFIRYRMECP